jgi:DnaJ-class molecular chaperone
VKEDDKCTDCNGSKYDYETKLLEIDIDKGIKNGEHIRLNKLGDEVDNAIEPGDIILEINEKKRDDMYREGNDLVVKRSILLSEALCGLSLAFKHLDGEIIVIESDKIIKPNMRHIISNLGFYNKNSKNNGDLIFEFYIVFPENIQENRKELIKKLLPKRVDHKIDNQDKHYKIEKSEEITKPGGNVNQEYEPIPDMNNCPIQ